MTASHTEVGPNRFHERFGRYYEDLDVGEIYEHRPDTTIPETDNTWFTLLTMNTHPMHFDAELSKRSTSEWMKATAGKVPAAPVRALPDALDNPNLAATSGIQSIGHPLSPSFRVLSSPIRLDGERIEARCAPALGADTDPLLGSLGYSATEIATVAGNGVIGVAP